MSWNAQDRSLPPIWHSVEARNFKDTMNTYWDIGDLDSVWTGMTPRPDFEKSLDLRW